MSGEPCDTCGHSPCLGWCEYCGGCASGNKYCVDCDGRYDRETRPDLYE